MRCCWLLVFAGWFVLLSGCATVERVEPITETVASIATEPPTVFSAPSVEVTRPSAIARLNEPQMNETSGFVGSERHTGVLYAINDSGNQPILFAIDGRGELIAQWSIEATNRDWEELDKITLDGQTYLIIGDTGDNLRRHGNARLHLIPEPDLPQTLQHIKPAITITYQYEDGARNVEAFSSAGQTLYMLSKEPVGSLGRSRSGIYRLQLPTMLNQINADEVLTAERIGTLPLRVGSVESTLAARLKGVDLSHPTAMAINRAGNIAYILTYREVLRVERLAGQSWAEAFTKPAAQLFSHPLRQAEAMGLLGERGLWLTSEGRGSALWVVPVGGGL